MSFVTNHCYNGSAITDTTPGVCLKAGFKDTFSKTDLNYSIENVIANRVKHGHFFRQWAEFQEAITPFPDRFA